LQERANAVKWTRRQWAAARLASRFSRRVPAEVSLQIAEVGAQNDLYIAEYNVWMHSRIERDQSRREWRALVPKGKRLITHWNLRDELKANYADKDGLAKQRTIVKIMERIVTQTIPLAVIDNPSVDWNPFTNTVVKATDVEDNAPKKTAHGDERA